MNKQLKVSLEEINSMLTTIKNSLVIFYKLSESVDNLSKQLKETSEHFSKLSEINKQLTIAYTQSEEKNLLLEKVLEQIKWANKRLED